MPVLTLWKYLLHLYSTHTKLDIVTHTRAHTHTHTHTQTFLSNSFMHTKSRDLMLKRREERRGGRGEERRGGEGRGREGRGEERRGEERRGGEWRGEERREGERRGGERRGERRGGESKERKHLKDTFPEATIVHYLAA